MLGDDHVPVEPVERFLGYLASIERSPNTVKAYAHDLKDWFTFLAGTAWTGGRSRWRTSPGTSRGCGCRRRPGTGRVAVLPSVEHHCAASSVNRKLAALASFCEFHARHGVPLAGLLVATGAPGRRRVVGVLVQTVPAPRHQERPDARACDHAELRSAAAAGADRG